MDETYAGQGHLEVSVRGRQGRRRATVNFLLRATRDRKDGPHFLRKAIGHDGTPAKITIGESGATRQRLN